MTSPSRFFSSRAATRESPYRSKHNHHHHQKRGRSSSSSDASSSDSDNDDSHHDRRKHGYHRRRGHKGSHHGHSSSSSASEPSSGGSTSTDTASDSDYHDFGGSSDSASADTSSSSDSSDAEWEGLDMDRHQSTWAKGLDEEYGGIRNLVLTERPRAVSWKEIWEDVDKPYEVSRFVIQLVLIGLFFWCAVVASGGEYAYQRAVSKGWREQLVPKSFLQPTFDLKSQVVTSAQAWDLVSTFVNATTLYNDSVDYIKPQPLRVPLGQVEMDVKTRTGDSLLFGLSVDDLGPFQPGRGSPEILRWLQDTKINQLRLLFIGQSIVFFDRRYCVENELRAELNYDEGSMTLFASVIVDTEMCKGESVSTVASAIDRVYVAICVFSIVSLLIHFMPLRPAVRLALHRCMPDRVDFPEGIGRRATVGDILWRNFTIWIVAAVGTTIMNLVLVFLTFKERHSFNAPIESLEIRFIFGICCFMSMIMLLPTTSQFPYTFTVFQNTLVAAFPFLSRLLIGVFPIYCGFVFFGMICFHLSSERFATFGLAMQNLFALMKGDYLHGMFRELYVGAGVMSRLYLYAFCVFFLILVFRIAMAIVGFFVLLHVPEIELDFEDPHARKGKLFDPPKERTVVVPLVEAPLDDGEDDDDDDDDNNGGGGDVDGGDPGKQRLLPDGSASVRKLSRKLSMSTYHAPSNEQKLARSTTKLPSSASTGIFSPPHGFAAASSNVSFTTGAGAGGGGGGLKKMGRSATITTGVTDPKSGRRGNVMIAIPGVTDSVTDSGSGTPSSNAVVTGAGALASPFPGSTRALMAGAAGPGAGAGPGGKTLVLTPLLPIPQAGGSSSSTSGKTSKHDRMTGSSPAHTPKLESLLDQLNNGSGGGGGGGNSYKSGGGGPYSVDHSPRQTVLSPIPAHMSLRERNVMMSRIMSPSMGPASTPFSMRPQQQQLQIPPLQQGGASGSGSALGLGLSDSSMLRRSPSVDQNVTGPVSPLVTMRVPLAVPSISAGISASGSASARAYDSTTGGASGVGGGGGVVGFDVPMTPTTRRWVMGMGGSNVGNDVGAQQHGSHARHHSQHHTFGAALPAAAGAFSLSTHDPASSSSVASPGVSGLGQGLAENRRRMSARPGPTPTVSSTTAASTSATGGNANAGASGGGGRADSVALEDDEEDVGGSSDYDDVAVMALPQLAGNRSLSISSSSSALPSGSTDLKSRSISFQLPSSSHHSSGGQSRGSLPSNVDALNRSLSMTGNVPSPMAAAVVGGGFGGGRGGPADSPSAAAGIGTGTGAGGGTVYIPMPRHVSNAPRMVLGEVLDMNQSRDVSITNPGAASNGPAPRVLASSVRESRLQASGSFASTGPGSGAGAGAGAGAGVGASGRRPSVVSHKSGRRPSFAVPDSNASGLFSNNMPGPSPSFSGGIAWGGAGGAAAAAGDEVDEREKGQQPNQLSTRTERRVIRGRSLFKAWSWPDPSDDACLFFFQNLSAFATPSTLVLAASPSSLSSSSSSSSSSSTALVFPGQVLPPPRPALAVPLLSLPPGTQLPLHLSLSKLWNAVSDVVTMDGAALGQHSLFSVFDINTANSLASLELDKTLSPLGQSLTLHVALCLYYFAFFFSQKLARSLHRTKQLFKRRTTSSAGGAGNLSSLIAHIGSHGGALLVPNTPSASISSTFNAPGAFAATDSTAETPVASLLDSSHTNAEESASASSSMAVVQTPPPPALMEQASLASVVSAVSSSASFPGAPVVAPGTISAIGAAALMTSPAPATATSTSRNTGPFPMQYKLRNWQTHSFPCCSTCLLCVATHLYAEALSNFWRRLDNRIFKLAPLHNNNSSRTQTPLLPRMLSSSSGAVARPVSTEPLELGSSASATTSATNSTNDSK